MPRKSDEDLFRESTMTFGEHLEEFRSCLFKALLWLVAGFLAGLVVARPVVHFIQGPIEGALTEHYKNAAIEKLKQMEEKGLPLPGTAEQLAGLVAQPNNLLPEEVFLDPSELLGQSRQLYGDLVQSRTEAIELLQKADPLLRRKQLPAGDPKSKLTREERDQASQAVRLLEPADAEIEGSKRGFTQEDLDRIVETIKDGKDLPKDELARIVEATKTQETRFREDLARARKATELFDSTRPPQRGLDEELERDDLARIFIWKPIESDPRIQTRALGAPEAFAIYIKASLLVGVLIASPGIFYHIWYFVAAGLYHHERRFVYTFGPFSLALFFAGGALVFFFVFQIVLRFLFTFNAWLGIGIEPRITEWLGFVLILPLGFGIAFQLPLVMLFLERIGIFNVEAYLSKWRIAVLVIWVVAMLLTPPDPGSMILMGIPLMVLYFGGILLCRYMPRRKSPYDEPED